MNNPLVVSRCNRIGDLASETRDLVQGERAIAQAGRKSLSLQQLHHQVVGSHVVQCADVRMIELRDDLGFACETDRKVLRGDFDRDFSTEPRVACPVDLAHAAGADRGNNLIRTEPDAWGKSHRSIISPSKRAEIDLDKVHVGHS